MSKPWSEVLADLARPWVLWSGGGSASAATVILAARGSNLTEAAIFVGAAWAGVAGIYWGKSFENLRVEQAKATRDAEVARAAPAAVTAATVAEAAEPATTPDGKLRPEDRLP